MRHLFYCPVSNLLRMDGQISPSQELKPFLFYNNLKHLFGLISCKLILRKEKHTNTIGSLLSQLDTKKLCHLLKKTVRNLKHNSYAVSCLALCILSCPVLQILYNVQSLVHGFMTFYAFNISNRTNSAVIMLKSGIVQSETFIISFSLLGSSGPCNSLNIFHICFLSKILFWGFPFHHLFLGCFRTAIH